MAVKAGDGSVITATYSFGGSAVVRLFMLVYAYIYIYIQLYGQAYKCSESVTAVKSIMTVH